jgi:hypothetical protein
MDGRIFEERGKPESIFFFVIPDAAKPRRPRNDGVVSSSSPESR